MESQVCRTAQEAGYRRYVARCKPFLFIATMHKRRQWALQNLRRNCMQVIWTDETALRLGEVVTYRYVTCRPGEGNLPECCIAHGKKGPLVRLDLLQSQNSTLGGGRHGGLDAKRYVEQILQGPPLAFLKQMQDQTGKSRGGRVKL
ncbi:hypothetical protein C8Q73DRAFT_654957 [Cubamyces lactineus]|nr:hypothetical protein C8Q73DRAFT_654957 [Cubamyces lactineus]